MRGWSVPGPVVDEAIEGIAADHTSSASRLARVALETMALATLEGPGGKDPTALAEVARRISEAGPVFEGRSMAKVLETDGLPATVIPDDAGVLRVADATYVLTGADSVLRDGSVVNKRGTRALAEAAAKHGKPMYVACETLKFDARFDAASWPGPRAGNLFDVTPSPLVTTVVTERVTYAPEIIRTLLAPARVASAKHRPRES